MADVHLPAVGAVRQRVRAVPHHRKVLAICVVSIFVVSIDGLMVPVIFPAVQDAFPDTPETTLSWMFTGFTIVLAALVVPSGRIGDRTGRRRVYVAGLLAWAAGALGAALAPTAGVLIAARLVQGAGQAFLLPASLGLLLPVVPAEEHTKALAAWIGAGTIGGAVGPSFGALMIAGPGWRAAFLLSGVTCLVILGPARRVLADTERRTDTRLPDPIGSALLAVMLASITLVILKSRAWGLTDPLLLGSMALAVAVLPVFLHRAATQPTPALDLDLFRRRTYRRVAVLATISSMALFTNLFLATQFLGDVWGYSVAKTGLALTPFPFAAGIAALWAGRRADQLGRRRVLLVGLTLSTAGWLWLGLMLGQEPAYVTEFLPGIVLLGLGGWGIVLTVMNAIAVTDLTDEDYSTGTAVLATLRQVGGILGVATVFGVVATEAEASRYAGAFLALVAVSVVTIALAYGLPRDEGVDRGAR